MTIGAQPAVSMTDPASGPTHPVPWHHSRKEPTTGFGVKSHDETARVRFASACVRLNWWLVLAW